MMTLDQDARFVAMLEECCQRVQRGERLERLLADYPAEYRDEIARLVPVAGRLRRLGRDPAPDFQARLERQLLAAMAETRRQQRLGLLGRLSRALAGMSALGVGAVALVVLVVLVSGGVGAVQASENSLPDSPLYQVKTARESFELVLARDGETRVGVHARQLAARSRELDRAVQAGKPRRVVEALALRVGWSTDRIVDQALDLRARGNPQPARRARVAIRAMQRQLDRLILEASPDLRPTLQRLKSFLVSQERRLVETSSTAGPGGGL